MKKFHLIVNIPIGRLRNSSKIFFFCLSRYFGEWGVKRNGDRKGDVRYTEWD